MLVIISARGGDSSRTFVVSECLLISTCTPLCYLIQLSNLDITGWVRTVVGATLDVIPPLSESGMDCGSPSESVSFILFLAFRLFRTSVGE